MDRSEVRISQSINPCETVGDVLKAYRFHRTMLRQIGENGFAEQDWSTQKGLIIDSVASNFQTFSIETQYKLAFRWFKKGVKEAKAYERKNDPMHALRADFFFGLSREIRNRLP